MSILDLVVGSYEESICVTGSSFNFSSNFSSVKFVWSILRRQSTAFSFNTRLTSPM